MPIAPMQSMKRLILTMARSIFWGRKSNLDRSIHTVVGRSTMKSTILTIATSDMNIAACETDQPNRTLEYWSSVLSTAGRNVAARNIGIDNTMLRFLNTMRRSCDIVRTENSFWDDRLSPSPASSLCAEILEADFFCLWTFGIIYISGNARRRLVVPIPKGMKTLMSAKEETIAGAMSSTNK